MGALEMRRSTNVESFYIRPRLNTFVEDFQEWSGASRLCGRARLSEVTSWVLLNHKEYVILVDT